MSGEETARPELPGFGEIISDEATLWRVMATAERMVADAEKRGAVKALAQINDHLLDYRDERREMRGRHTRWALGVEEAAGEVRAFSVKVESGEVTL